MVFKSELLARAFPLKEGDIFSADKIRKALDNYKKLYGEYGYIDFVATPMTESTSQKKIVNLTMEFDQQKQFFVRRIEFSGNTTTRDKVIRREILLDEGQVFNNRLWELSLLRLNQLNYFDTIKPENAELKRNVKAGTVDIKLKLKEKGKQSISFSGGVSGIAGTFIGASYSTNNFLGLGETLSLIRADRQLPAQHSVRLHRTVSVRPAHLHRLHDFHQQVRLQPGQAAGHRCSARKSRSIRRCRKTTPPTRRAYGVCQLPAAEVFLYAHRGDLRLFDHQHSNFQHFGAIAV